MLDISAGEESDRSVPRPRGGILRGVGLQATTYAVREFTWVS